jgi:hypothetical protein
MANRECKRCGRVRYTRQTEGEFICGVCRQKDPTDLLFDGDAQQEAEYDRGFIEGFNDGYQQGYEDGLAKGKRAQT